MELNEVLRSMAHLRSTNSDQLQVDKKQQTDDLGGVRDPREPEKLPDAFQTLSAEQKQHLRSSNNRDFDLPKYNFEKAKNKSNEKGQILRGKPTFRIDLSTNRGDPVSREMTESLKAFKRNIAMQQLDSTSKTLISPRSAAKIILSGINEKKDKQYNQPQIQPNQPQEQSPKITKAINFSKRSSTKLDFDTKISKDKEMVTQTPKIDKNIVKILLALPPLPLNLYNPTAPLLGPILLKSNPRSVYYGQMKGGIPHGQGTLIFPNFVYLGEFYQGERHGIGLQITNKGQVLEGLWFDGFFEGKAKDLKSFKPEFDEKNKFYCWIFGSEFVKKDGSCC